MITGSFLVMVVVFCSLHTGAGFLNPSKPLLVNTRGHNHSQHIFSAIYRDNNGYDKRTYNATFHAGLPTDRIDQKFETICRFHEETENTYAGVIHEKLNKLWTYNSLAIEGNSLSYGDISFYLDHGLTVAGKPIKDFLEASGHYEAISMLKDYVGQLPMPYSRYFDSTINQLLTGHVTSIPAVDTQGNRVLVPYTAGSYRTQPTHVRTKSGDIHRYVDALQIDSEMATLMEYVNNEDSTVHPIIRAAIAHYNFVRIHPFQDGNGRGARILMNLVLCKAGLCPNVVQMVDRVAYIDALGAADRGDITPFVEFIATSMEKTLDIVLETIKKDLT